MINSRSFDLSFKTGSQEHIREANISSETRLEPKPALQKKTDGPNIGAGWKAHTQEFVMYGFAGGGGTSERSLLSAKNLWVALSGLEEGRDSYV